MDELLTRIDERRDQTVNLIRRLVECESPSGDAAALARVADLIAEETAGLASTRRWSGGHIRCDFDLPGRRKSGRLLALGHIDTVWPIGTLKTMPFEERDGRLWGPGVLDMKSGIAFFLTAMRVLRDLNRPVARRVSLLLVTDEEVGSATSRAITEREAKRSEAVLVLEPGTGLEGKLKTARKGVGDYTITVHGRAAHSGVDFAAGASAVVEVARQIERIAALSDPARGVTLNPGIVQGGTRVNVVAAEARVHVDLRVWSMADARRIDRALQRLKPVDPRCRIEVTGGLNRPAMERTRGVARLFSLARSLAKGLGVDLEESSTGGASDGNFTAGLGIPTLDGLGGVGEGAHAPHESILVDRITDRTALLTKLVLHA
jgi:glutamate carboxypeptidase